MLAWVCAGVLSSTMQLTLLMAVRSNGNIAEPIAFYVHAYRVALSVWHWAIVGLAFHVLMRFGGSALATNSPHALFARGLTAVLLVVVSIQAYGVWREPSAGYASYARADRIVTLGYSLLAGLAVRPCTRESAISKCEGYAIVFAVFPVLALYDILTTFVLVSLHRS